MGYNVETGQYEELSMDLESFMIALEESQHLAFEEEAPVAATTEADDFAALLNVNW